MIGWDEVALSLEYFQGLNLILFPSSELHVVKGGRRWLFLLFAQFPLHRQGHQKHDSVRTVGDFFSVDVPGVFGPSALVVEV